MSQIPTENDEDNRSIAASDFVQFDQPDEVPDHQEEETQQQQHGQQQFGLNQDLLDWTMNTGGASNNCNDLKELKWMMANLQAKNQTLQKAMENIELKAEIRALKEDSAQKANYQALETKFAKMLKQMEQLESKNRKLEKKLSNHELQTSDNGALDGKMEESKHEFAKMLSTQNEHHQKEMIQLELNLSGKLAAFRKEMQKRAIDGNEKELDCIWGQQMIKSKKLVNPKGILWSGLDANVSISEFGLKATTGSSQYVFAMEGFAISGEQCRQDNFPFLGTIVLYYEVTASGWLNSVGFSDGNDGSHACTNSYAIKLSHWKYDNYWLSGKQHKFEYPANKATGAGDVLGCGLLLNPKNEWAVFFTLNGILLGKPVPISPTVDRLYPTVYMGCTSVVANFGDHLIAKPFKFDIDICPGLVFE